MDNNMDGVQEGIEGTFTATLIIYQDGSRVLDCSDVTGEFSGTARTHEGCVSPKEAPTLECPAEGFVNQCEEYDDHFCFGLCDPPEEGGLCVDFDVVASQCEVVDCLNVICPLGPVSLEGDDDFGSFQIIIGDHIVGC